MNSNISIKSVKMRRKDRVKEHEGGKPAVRAVMDLGGLGGASMMVGLIYIRILEGNH